MSTKEYHKKYRESHSEERKRNWYDRYQRLKSAGLCTKCGKSNDSSFVTCSSCRKAISEHKKNWVSTPKGKKCIRAYSAMRRKTAEYLAWRRNYMKERRKNDMQFKLASRLTDRLSKALKGIGSGHNAIEYLGCSIEELKIHLSSQFEPDMTWENYGDWHIDHIIPLSLVDLTDENSIRTVCHYTNLQPLWAVDNIKKSNRKPGSPWA